MQIRILLKSESVYDWIGSNSTLRSILILKEMGQKEYQEKPLSITDK